MTEPDRRFAVNSREIAAKVVDGEAVLINLSTGVYYSLAGAGAAAWELLAAGLDADSVTRELAARYDAEPGVVGADVTALVDDLLEERLLVAAPDASAPEQAPAVEANGAYEKPVLDKYTDLGDLLALDPPMPGLSEIPWTRPQG